MDNKETFKEPLNKEFLIQKCSELVSQNGKYKQQIESLEKELAEYEAKNEFIYKAGRSTLIIKLGDSGRGWIPDKHHFVKIIKFVKDTQLDEKYNILLYHYAFNMQIIE